MKAVLRKMKMGAYAKNDELKEVMWQKLGEVRQELLNVKEQE